MPNVTYFTRALLAEANRLAAQRGYNRQLDGRFITTLPAEGRFPVRFSMIHEHAAGRAVDPHVRCVVLVGYTDERAPVDVQIDCDLALFNTLPALEVAA